MGGRREGGREGIKMEVRGVKDGVAAAVRCDYIHRRRGDGSGQGWRTADKVFLGLLKGESIRAPRRGG